MSEFDADVAQRNWSRREPSGRSDEPSRSKAGVSRIQRRGVPSQRTAVGVQGVADGSPLVLAPSYSDVSRRLRQAMDGDRLLREGLAARRLE